MCPLPSASDPWMLPSQSQADARPRSGSSWHRRLPMTDEPASDESSLDWLVGLSSRFTRPTYRRMQPSLPVHFCTLLLLLLRDTAMVWDGRKIRGADTRSSHLRVCDGRCAVGASFGVQSRS